MTTRRRELELAQGDLSYLEAVNQATLANAYARYAELGMLITRRDKAAKSIALVALHPDWMPARDHSGAIRPEGRLWRFLERLGTYRREGKNRRDIGTMPTRTMSAIEASLPPVIERVALEHARL